MTKGFILFGNIACTDLTCSWYLKSGPWLCFCLRLWTESSNSPMTHAISGPATIHFISCGEFSVRLIAPPSPLTIELFCSWAWSSTIQENERCVFLMTNFLFSNCSATAGWAECRFHMSLRCTGGNYLL